MNNPIDTTGLNAEQIQNIQAIVAAVLGQPAPVTPRMGPLSRADVPHGSWFRAPTGDDCCPLQITDGGVYFRQELLRTWQALRDYGWRIIRPGQPPAPCEKPTFDA